MAMFNVPVQPDWMRDALCREPEYVPLFRRAMSDGASKGHVRCCREVCERCLVQSECLDHALVVLTRTEHCGVWAGLTGREVIELQNRRAHGFT